MASQSSLPNENKANLCRHLHLAAENTPDLLAVAVQKSVYGDLRYQEIDFLNLNKQSDAIAHALTSYGIEKGQKAVLMVTPSIEFFALTFALFKAGIIPIMVDPGMGIKNLKQCFEESKPDAFIGIPKAHIARKLFGWGKGSVKKLVTAGGISLLDKLGVKQPFGGYGLPALLKRFPMKAPFEMQYLEPDEMCAILFTSGSTGIPKGVVYSHKMFEAQISALKDDYQIVPGERDLATFPLFSLFGPALGMASIVPDMDASKPITADPDFIFAAVEKYQCTNLFANPALLEILGAAGEKTNHQLPSLKRVISAGAPATIDSIKRFSKMLSQNVEVLNSYGATESLPLTKIGSQALLKTTDITDSGGGICVGKPINGVTVDIIDITEATIATWSDELKLPTNTIGEIVVAGPMVSQAYYHREQATAQAKIKNADTNQMMHRMGDLGYLDDDGQLWMCGRKAHRVETMPLIDETDSSSNLDGVSTANAVFFSIPCERIFNTHKLIKRAALVGVNLQGNADKNDENQLITPVLCIELIKNKQLDSALFKEELVAIAKKHAQTSAIEHFILHDDFPVDVRHNAKIFREKLAVWANNNQRNIF